MAGDDFRPTASRAVLERRAELARRLRAFFDARGYLEVETPLLSADTVVDRHIDPMVVTDARGVRRFLQSSPEFAMKRLVASGFEAVYQLTRAFRSDEAGALHNPEFTIAEWYRVGDGMCEQLDVLDALSRELLADRWSGAPLAWPAERLTYREAFEHHAGIDPFAATDDDLVALARARGIAAPASLAPSDRDGWLQLVMGELVEPHLGVRRPTFVHDYPASQAALSRVRPGSPPVAERFELYVDGLELANGFHELLDADELARRNEEHNRQRRGDGKDPLPGESRLLDAMRSGLPGCAGVALGFDRIVMLATGADSIAEVIAFPASRA